MQNVSHGCHLMIFWVIVSALDLIQAESFS
jgi:hypothetical protein